MVGLDDLRGLFQPMILWFYDNPPSGPSIKSMSLQLKDKDVLRDSVKCFAQVQVDDIGCSSLTHQSCNLIVEGHQICQAWFALSEAILAVTSHLLDLARYRGEMDCIVRLTDLFLITWVWNWKCRAFFRHVLPMISVSLSILAIDSSF